MGNGERSKVAAAVALLLWLATTSSAWAGRRTVIVRSASLTAVPGGYVSCRVDARGTAPIGIVATIVAADGSDVTEFGSSFRSAPAVTADGFYYAEETSGSQADTARSCRAKVTGARGRDIHLSFEAFGADGTPLGAVEKR